MLALRTNEQKQGKGILYPWAQNPLEMLEEGSFAMVVNLWSRDAEIRSRNVRGAWLGINLRACAIPVLRRVVGR